MGDRLRQVGLVLLLWAVQAAWTASAAPSADEVLDEHVNRLTSELRCLVCQNQTVADSQAELAVQLRNEVRTQLREGVTDAQVRDFMVQRYGEFVLYKPPLSPHTSLLWAGPLLLLMFGVGLFGLSWWHNRLRHNDSNVRHSTAKDRHQEQSR